MVSGHDGIASFYVKVALPVVGGSCMIFSINHCLREIFGGLENSAYCTYLKDWRKGLQVEL